MCLLYTGWWWVPFVWVAQHPVRPDLDARQQLTEVWGEGRDSHHAFRLVSLRVLLYVFYRKWEREDRTWWGKLKVWICWVKISRVTTFSLVHFLEKCLLDVNTLWKLYTDRKTCLILGTYSIWEHGYCKHLLYYFSLATSLPEGVSLSSSVQRCTSRANMPRPSAVLCSCKPDRASPLSPE